MNNLADIVEKWILEKLAEGEEEIIILRRNEIASALNCAPSQISYVLNTRFTIRRGFLVESRRGLGGFIRIARLPFDMIYDSGQTDEEINLRKMQEILERLKNNNLLTVREAAILANCAGMICEHAEPCHHSKFLKALLLSLKDTR
ncbi:MAG: CtsR family transcriptional regulator [Sporomusaceae bacterium]|jgi:transcriptional regulator CtsR|nr:CtsR family transcriptional regulator [Sporomusaceae bacterium]